MAAHEVQKNIWFLDTPDGALVRVSVHPTQGMPRTLSSARHKRLTELLTQCREAAGLTQQDVAKALGRHQPFVSTIEAGQRRVDVVELLDLAGAIGFDVHTLIEELKAMSKS